MEIGKMTITEAYPHLKSIALAYGLKLNRSKTAGGYKWKYV